MPRTLNMIGDPGITCHPEHVDPASRCGDYVTNVRKGPLRTSVAHIKSGYQAARDIIKDVRMHVVGASHTHAAPA